MVEIDHLCTIVESIVGFGSRRGEWVLCSAKGGGLEVLQRIGGEVVEVMIGEAKLVVIVIVHGSSICRGQVRDGRVVVLLLLGEGGAAVAKHTEAANAHLPFTCPSDAGRRQGPGAEHDVLVLLSSPGSLAQNLATRTSNGRATSARRLPTPFPLSALFHTCNITPRSPWRAHVRM